MEVRYQRDLYRVQLCCDTEKEEAAFGYPLQMCLRNTITGLLACQVQGTDERLTICWDVTSRHSLAQIVGEGQIAPHVLQKILQALLQTMDAMARYLLPCEYLVLDPSLVFLTPESGAVGFVCDFEDAQSFRKTLLVFGEYVLEHMDHREQKAMHLGYGLYRLAVEESFDKEGLRRLCTEIPLPGTEQPEKTAKNRTDEKSSLGQRTDPPYSGQSVYRERTPGNRAEYADERTILHEQEREAARQQRADALEAFFAEDEEETKLQLSPWQLCGGCAAAILIGTGIMEGVQYFRNGRYLQPIWLLVALVLFLLSAAAMLVLWKISVKKEEKTKTPENRMKHSAEKYQNRKNHAGQQSSLDYAMQHYAENVPDRPYGKAPESGKTDFASEPSTMFNHENPPQSMETVVLNRTMPETGNAQLRFADGREVSLCGQQWLVGKSPLDADICLQEPTVSRLHARIWKKEGAYYIEDLHSRNGTMVEGITLEPGEKRRLEDGMKLSFAEHVCAFTVKQAFGEMKYSCQM